jgi:hypothetical protein
MGKIYHCYLQSASYIAIVACILKVTMENTIMPIDYILPLGMTMSLITWALVHRWYVHPMLERFPVERALEPILYLHTFRYIGLMFLIPGVTSEVLDARFSYPAAYGDLVAAILAFVTIGAIRLKTKWAMLSAWVFNIWGMADLINAVGRGILFTDDGHLGATYWIPATIVPLLLVTHVYIFILLVKHLNKS